MDSMISVLIGLVPGLLIGWLVVTMRAKAAQDQSGRKHQREVEELNAEHDERLELLKEEIKAEQDASEDSLKQQIEEAKSRSKSLASDEEELREKRQKLNSDMAKVQSQTDSLANKEERIEQRLASLQSRESELETALERVAGLTRDEALKKLEDELRDRAHERAAAELRRIQQKGQEQLKEAAASVLAKAVFRYGSETIQEITTTIVHLPSDDVKGRIIGREGRNIQSFEEATGVDVIIDDTPGIITLSSFSPERRLIAHEAMDRLLRDGRIHPTRIEESVSKARKNVDRALRQRGEQASSELDIHGMDGNLLDLLGRLSIHQINGQNQLDLSLATARLAERLADELNINPKPCKRAGLLALIGSAADHHQKGASAEISVALARRHGENQKVVVALEDLLSESGPSTVFGIVVQLAQKLARSRPGVQQEQLAECIERLESLEQLAAEEEGVRQVHVLQAGTEIRVLVDPTQLSEGKLMALAQRLVRKIEDRADRLGEVQVHVVRETRVTETAM